MLQMDSKYGEGNKYSVLHSRNVNLKINSGDYYLNFSTLFARMRV